MPKGHPGQPGPFRLLSAGFGKAGASAIVARSPRTAKGGTAAIIPLYSYEYCTAFLGLGSDTETRERVKTSRRFITKGRTIQ